MGLRGSLDAPTGSVLLQINLNAISSRLNDSPSLTKRAPVPPRPSTVKFLTPREVPWVPLWARPEWAKRNLAGSVYEGNGMKVNDGEALRRAHAFATPAGSVASGGHKGSVVGGGGSSVASARRTVSVASHHPKWEEGGDEVPAVGRVMSVGCFARIGSGGPPVVKTYTVSRPSTTYMQGIRDAISADYTDLRATVDPKEKMAIRKDIGKLSSRLADWFVQPTIPSSQHVHHHQLHTPPTWIFLRWTYS